MTLITNFILAGILYQIQRFVCITFGPPKMEYSDALNKTIEYLLPEKPNMMTRCLPNPSVQWYDIILVCVQTAVCLLGIAGSAVALGVLSRDNKALLVNFLLRVLCVVDICYLSCCLVHFPIATFFRYMEMEDSLHPTWFYVKAAVYSLTPMTQLLTIWITVLIAAFRYIAIRFPHKARQVLTLANAK